MPRLTKVVTSNDDGDVNDYQKDGDDGENEGDR